MYHFITKFEFSFEKVDLKRERIDFQAWRNRLSNLHDSNREIM